MAQTQPENANPRRNGFDFARDTFAFPNELVWKYRFDGVSGRATIERCLPKPSYTHRCFVLVRSARQFFDHARFEVTRPEAAPEAYRDLARAVVRRNPRQASPPEQRIVVPGFDCLRELSRAQGPALKGACGGAWESYMLRSHWRMVFPISRTHQAQTAAQLLDRVRAGALPIVHLVRFPQLTINHGALVFGAEEVEGRIEFRVYDPNVTEHPCTLTYEHSAKTFIYPRQVYWGGGRVDVIEIYRGWFY